VTAEPALYDFRRPNRFSREDVRALQMVNDTFARQFAMILSTTQHATCHVSVTSVRQYTCDEYMRTVPNPSLLALLHFEPLAGTGVFQLPMDIVMSMVDRLLGGPGGPNQPDRGLSEIEIGLVRQLLGRIMSELTFAFESLTAVIASVLDLESDPQFLKVAAASEPVIVSEFAIRIGDQQATGTLCIPFATLQPALNALADSHLEEEAEKDDSAAQAVERQLHAVPLEVTVAFQGVTVTSLELLSLSVGDVLPLRHPITQPLTVLADGVRVAAAVPGSHGRNLACQIVSI